MILIQKKKGTALNSCFHNLVYRPKDTDKMANRLDPNQTDTELT